MERRAPGGPVKIGQPPIVSTMDSTFIPRLAPGRCPRGGASTNQIPVKSVENGLRPSRRPFCLSPRRRSPRRDSLGPGFNDSQACHGGEIDTLPSRVEAAWGGLFRVAGVSGTLRSGGLWPRRVRSGEGGAVRSGCETAETAEKPQSRIGQSGPSSARNNP